MEESVSYQMILREGEAKGEAKAESKWRLEEARNFIVLIGKEHLGPPDATARRKLRTIADLDRLHQLGLQVGKVRSWKDLFAVE